MICESVREPADGGAVGRYHGSMSDPGTRLAAYFAAHSTGLVAAFLFGSTARADSHGESDVDVGVLFTRPYLEAAGDVLTLRLELTADLVHATGREDIDLVVMNTAPPPLNRAIFEEGLELVVQDSAALEDFRRYIYHRAADLAPWLRRWHRRKLELAVAGEEPH